jgi:hypothetical protein
MEDLGATNLGFGISLGELEEEERECEDEK